MIRCKITPKFTESGDGTPGVYLLMEWVEVVDEQIVGVIRSEEFELKQNREGCSYITRGGMDQGHFLPGTFWVDEQGHRHFVMQAEPGAVGLFGEETNQQVNR